MRNLKINIKFMMAIFVCFKTKSLKSSWGCGINANLEGMPNGRNANVEGMPIHQSKSSKILKTEYR